MNNKQLPIEFWNRREGRLEEENVYGDFLLRALYGNKPGQVLTDQIFSKAIFSKVYGAYQSSGLSKMQIPSFIEKFDIPIEDYEDQKYLSFNDFFIRKFKPGLRRFVADPAVFPAFAEARYYAYENVHLKQGLPIKGKVLSIENLLGDAKLSKTFENGPAFLARLCPVDYHRFHFPDDGRMTRQFTVSGGLHSVNPVALGARPDILMTNERQVSILETSFGKLAYVEVGALCVGKIVQTHPSTEIFSRGAEKGYFLFGASTVVVLGEKGAWVPHSDLLEKSSQGIETLVELGTGIGSKLK